MLSVADDIDKALVERVLGGDEAVFGSLIDRHRSAAVAFARRMLSAADAENVVQEALLGAFLNLRKLRDQDRLPLVAFGHRREPRANPSANKSRGLLPGLARWPVPRRLQAGGS